MTFSRFVRPILILGTCVLGAGAASGQAVADRVEVLTDIHGYFPCMDCHADQETNPTPRILEEEHEIPLEWTDDDGVTQLVPFGRRVALVDLLDAGAGDLAGDNMQRIGVRLSITDYMQENDLTAADSVWTLVHGGGNLWCLDCHNTDDRDKLVKLNGDLLTFNQSQLLCGECHGPELRDWERGIHGTTTGYWDLARDAGGESFRKLCVECHTPHDPAFPSLTPLAGPITRVDGPGERRTGDTAGHATEEEH
ncbi:MAG: hypothetical protein GY838_03565 [bacterium]|nr:hypothetical protein [bacterium]